MSIKSTVTKPKTYGWTPEKVRESFKGNYLNRRDDLPKSFLDNCDPKPLQQEIQEFLSKTERH